MDFFKVVSQGLERWLSRQSACLPKHEVLSLDPGPHAKGQAKQHLSIISALRQGRNRRILRLDPRKSGQTSEPQVQFWSQKIRRRSIEEGI